MKQKKTKNWSRRTSKIDMRRPGRFPQSTDWHVLGAIVLFVVAAWLTRPEEVSALEESLFLFFYNIPDAFIPVFFVLTQLGSIYMLGLLGLLYLFGRRYTIVIRLLMAGTLAYLMAGVGKDLFGRGRPNELFEDIVFRDTMIRGPGFPSGHTAMAVALGLTLAHYASPGWRWPILILTVLAAVSRMVLGVHTPLDVVGGFAIGWGSAMLFRHVQVKDRP
jgi:glycosyltransferase 2 family protein